MDDYEDYFGGILIVANVIAGIVLVGVIFRVLLGV